MDNRLFDSIEKIEGHISEIKVILAKQEVTLQEHIRRSLANEQGLKLLAEELKPIQRHVLLVNAVLKAIGWIASSGIVVALINKFF